MATNNRLFDEIVIISAIDQAIESYDKDTKTVEKKDVKIFDKVQRCEGETKNNNNGYK